MGKYKTISDLPEGVRDNLPRGGQEIYKSAFNSALEQYDDGNQEQSQEQYAHRVAWSAVKQKYEKGSDSWHMKEET